jgi:predicted phosphodiesterase
MSDAAGGAERTHVVGLISDTHGLLRPEVFPALAGVELILHAGDVGGADILAGLGTIAPVLAVYGNTDPPGHPGLARERIVSLGGVTIHVSHGHEVGRPTPERCSPPTRRTCWCTGTRTGSSSHARATGGWW